MLTDTQCKAAKPKEKSYKLSDSNGLYLEVKPNGVKAWRYRFKLKQDGSFKESIFALGTYVPPDRNEHPEEAKARRAGGLLTLAEARDERTKARALVKQGINPSQHRKLERVRRQHEAAVTFEAVAKEWVALRSWEAVTKERRLDMLERVVFPKIGAFPIKDIKPTHVLDVIQTSAKKNGPSVAAEARRTISGIFDHAIATLRADSDPTYAVRKALPPNKTQHKPALSIAEIGQLLLDVQNHHGRHETVTAFRLMWLTLCRPSEAVDAEWAEFDLENRMWAIPAHRMKKRQEHRMLLPQQAVALLQGMKAISGNRVHVFPGRDNPREAISPESIRQMLYKIGWKRKFSPHAVRTTGSTRLNELGYRADLIERQLAHVEPNAVRRTYNHAEYLAERGEMMQKWADLLDAWATAAEQPTK